MSDSQTSFKVGLALAGAASAGAYTAGVLDFLVEALDAWYAARARGERVPRHDVSLEVASGASAGAMCAALLSVALPYRFPPVRLDAQRRPSAGASGNPFYSAWVEKIDIRRMLETSDLAGGGLDALLNCEVLDQILREALDFRGTAPLQRPYVARPFVNRYTLGNLRGVPYDVSYRGLMGASDTMYAHDDFLGFLVGGDGLPAPHGCGKGHQRVGAIASSQAPDWQRLGNAALASGAFPLALKPRRVSRDAADYAVRDCDPDASDPADRRVRVPPAWPGKTPPPDYSFVSVDGGFFTNEPLDLARSVIADPVAGNPAEGSRSNGAVLMVAPLIALPNDGDRLPAAPAPHELLQPLFWSLVDQCRFRPADIALAHDPDVYNRFLVTPVDSKSWAKGATWVAGGPLQGFFGFLHEDYRKHDYQLGRNNCQRFLRQDFRLPQDNPCVAYGYAELPPEQRQAALDADGTLPLIPLLGAVAQDEPLCDWPAGLLDVEALMKPIGARVEAVYRYYRNNLGAAAGGGLQGLLAKGYLQVGWWAGRPQVIGAIRQAIADALQQQRL